MRFAGAADPLAAASFGVLDEALAAGLGNGVVGQRYVDSTRFARRLARDDGLDRYRAAGLIARALLPSLPEVLERGVTVSSPELVRRYLTAARVMYEAPQPRALDYLHGQVSVAAPRFDAALRRLQDATNAGYPYARAFGSWSSEAQMFVDEHALVSTVVFAGSDERPAVIAAALGATVARRDEVALLTERTRGFAYGLRRTPMSYAFLLVAPDAATMTELADGILLLPAREGLLLELPK